MFNAGLLDVAIGLIFIYLLLSLICTALNEMIEARRKMRASDLERGIRELLQDPKGTDLVKKLYNHHLIFGLFQGTYDPSKITEKGRYQSGSNLPSYIPARNFALALMDIVLPAKSVAPNTPSISGATGATVSPSPPDRSLTSSTGTISSPLQPLREAIGSIQNPKVEQALMTLVDAAGDDVSRARENIETWFNSGMDRVSGWYKRRTQWISFALGLIVAIALNVDTITISSSLASNKAMRDALVATAQEYARASNASVQPPGQNSNAKPEACQKDESSSACQNEPVACRKDENSSECKVERNLKKIQDLSLPVGWNPQTMPASPSWTWLVKLLGWLLLPPISLENRRVNPSESNIKYLICKGIKLLKCCDSRVGSKLIGGKDGC